MVHDIDAIADMLEYYDFGNTFIIYKFKTPYVCILYDLYPDIAVALGVVSKRHWLARFWESVNQRVWKRAMGIVVLRKAMKRQVVVNCPAVADKVSGKDSGLILKLGYFGCLERKLGN